MSERKRIEVPDKLPCKQCGALCELVKVAHIDAVEEGAVIAEVRCANGHVVVRFLKPGQDAIDRGRELAEKYGW